jgi:hypothetical protein
MQYPHRHQRAGVGSMEDWRVAVPGCSSASDAENTRSAIMNTFIEDFRHTVNRAAERLLEYSEPEAGYAVAPGKWSRKEIVGHLIDSAANNHARFVRAQLQDDLTFIGYDQDAWVRVQRYQDRPWVEIVRLWQAYNLHLAHVMEAADPDSVSRPRVRHNLSELAWEPMDPSQPATLGNFIRDYAGHLNHHLAQALADNAPSEQRASL